MALSEPSAWVISNGLAAATAGSLSYGLVFGYDKITNANPNARVSLKGLGEVVGTAVIASPVAKIAGETSKVLMDSIQVQPFIRDGLVGGIASFSAACAVLPLRKHLSPIANKGPILKTAAMWSVEGVTEGFIGHVVGKNFKDPSPLHYGFFCGIGSGAVRGIQANSGKGHIMAKTLIGKSVGALVAAPLQSYLFKALKKE